MSIVITTVPSSTRKPGAYGSINTSTARLGLPAVSDRVLLLGMKLTGSGTATLLTPVRVYTLDEAKAYFGSGSPLAHMVEIVLAENPAVAELWAIPQAENGGGTAATGSIVVAISSLTAGTLTVWIGRRSLQIAVSSTDTANALASSISAAINADADLPVTATVATNTVTITSRLKGTFANSWVLASSFTGTGLTLTLTNPSGGAGDPNVQDALTPAYPVQYDVIISMFNDSTSLATTKTHLDNVAGATEQRPGVAVAGATGTLGTVTTLTAAVNSGRIWVPYLRGTRSHPMELAAACGARLVQQEDRALPLNFIGLTTVVPPDSSANYLSRTEQESCLSNGASPLMVGPGAVVQIVRSVTTYVRDGYGNVDDTLLDLQSIRVLDYVREVVRTKFMTDFGRMKVADVARGPNTTDPEQIRLWLIGVCQQIETDKGYLENVAELADSFVVERDASVPTRVNAVIPADIVDGLHVFAFSVDLILG